MPHDHRMRIVALGSAIGAATTAAEPMLAASGITLPSTTGLVIAGSSLAIAELVHHCQGMVCDMELCKGEVRCRACCHCGPRGLV
jgi:hypothetical protein